MNNNVHIVILAGGQGTRFWPVSRCAKPKQFLSLFGGKETLIQATLRRVRDLVSSDEHCWVVTNKEQAALVREQLPKVRVIEEPSGRNTAASIALAAFQISKINSSATIVVLSADHVVKNEEQLLISLKTAIEYAANNDVLVTLGITPSAPHTGYGYIKRDKKLSESCYSVSRFYEKPNFERASQYVSSGEYYWNSGMFVWSASSVLKALKEFLPNHFEVLATTEIKDSSFDGAFAKLESISIDIGVLEHAKNCVVVETKNLGWSDVGSWDAWGEERSSDASGNTVEGDALLVDSKNCIISSPHRLIAVLGVDDLVVIDSGDALLICPKDKVQDVKLLVDKLKEKNRKELI